MQTSFTTLFGVIWFLPYFIISVSTISVTLSPTAKSVFLNGSVEFNCKIRNDDGFGLFWLITYYHGIEGYVDAESTASIVHEEDGHGSYSLAYSKENDDSSGVLIQNLVLRIDRVQAIDAGIYSCGYGEAYPSLSPLGTWATLTVLVPPNETAPRCSVSPSFVSLGTIIMLTCEMSGGKPLPGLTWYRESTLISSTISTLNTIFYTITANDNGVPFTCVANGSALTHEGSCSVTPFQVDPSVSVSYSPRMPFKEHSNVIFTCTGFELPSVSTITWLYNDQSFADETIGSEYQIIDLSDASSELRLIGIPLFTNNSEIKCRVETPSGLTFEQAVVISINPDQPAFALEPSSTNSTATEVTPSQTAALTKKLNNPNVTELQLPSIIIPIATAAAGGSILTAVIAIIIYRCKNSTKQSIHESFQAAVISDSVHQIGAISSDNINTHTILSTSSDGYVISQISGTASPGTARIVTTVNSDHIYETPIGGQSGNIETRASQTPQSDHSYETPIGNHPATSGNIKTRSHQTPKTSPYYIEVY